MTSRTRLVCRGPHSDQGIAHVEVAIGSAVLLVLFGLVVFAGRTAALDTDVQTAAAAAARAASLQATPTGATAAAQQTAAANLQDAAVSCTSLNVDVTVGSMEPGNTVSVSVSCIAGFSDLAPLAMPGQRSFSASASEIVDTYRGHG
jgi:Flp pilus assembly protein TadG